MRTFQLRRYELEPDLAQQFIAWVNQVVIPIRESMGYRVEWMYFDSSNSQLIWLVSLQADQSGFESADQAWYSSSERAAAVLTMPKALLKANISFVEKI